MKQPRTAETEDYRFLLFVSKTGEGSFRLRIGNSWNGGGGAEENGHLFCIKGIKAALFSFLSYFPLNFGIQVDRAYFCIKWNGKISALCAEILLAAAGQRELRFVRAKKVLSTIHGSSILNRVLDGAHFRSRNH
ncbi:hypothetical protein CDAR_97211 [Caerostris darwini]|uniref:Uncharacterized protein n=1 Tax=Caerostris darwini TaxID=1538125 RepID=A0AAV4QM04_9ARAC|nr:hypothetical protein CDAR_97211 [Caerostris darwini]